MAGKDNPADLVTRGESPHEFDTMEIGSFVDAFNRIVIRRGVTKKMWSENDKNLVGRQKFKEHQRSKLTSMQ